QVQYTLAPAYRLDLRPVDVWVGPVLKYADTDLDPARRIGTERPYGTDGFGQAGLRLRVDLGRDYEQARGKGPQRGWPRTEAGFYPTLWSVRDTFGRVQ